MQRMDAFTKRLKGYLPVTTAEDNSIDDVELGTDANMQSQEPSLLGGCFDLTYKQRITGFAMSASAGALFLFFVCSFIWFLSFVLHFCFSLIVTTKQTQQNEITKYCEFAKRKKLHI